MNFKSLFLFCISLLAVSPAHAADRDYGKIPLSFEANLGQADKSVKFLSRGPAFGFFDQRGGDSPAGRAKACRRANETCWQERKIHGNRRRPALGQEPLSQGKQSQGLAARHPQLCAGPIRRCLSRNRPRLLRESAAARI